jgi:hypothetical protein
LRFLLIIGKLSLLERAVQEMPEMMETPEMLAQRVLLVRRVRGLMVVLVGPPLPVRREIPQAEAAVQRVLLAQRRAVIQALDQREVLAASAKLAVLPALAETVRQEMGVAQEMRVTPVLLRV